MTASRSTTAAALSRIVRSGRVYVGVGVNALSSVGNFVIGVAVARSTSIDAFGQFAIAFALYALITGVVRAGVAEPLLATAPTVAEFRSTGRRTSLVAGFGAVATAAAGVVVGSPYLLLTALAIHGLCLFDYSKTMNLAAFRRSTAGWQECCWLVASLVGAGLALTGAMSGFGAYATWALSGAVIGYGSVLLQRIELKPGWGRGTVGTRTALAFSGDYAIGSGSAQIGFNLIGAVAGLATVGALRAGGTLLGPVGLVVASARTLAIPYLARRSDESAVRQRAFAGTLVLAAVAIPVLSVVAFLPDAVGSAILGENWVFAVPVLPFLALELLFTTLATMPFAGFRALLAGRTTLMIRSALAVLRIGAAAVAAVLGGAMAAAITFALVSGIGLIVWWVGYLVTLKKVKM